MEPESTSPLALEPVRATAPARTLRRAAAWTALDQCLFGFSTLGLNLLLGRWLEPTAYGAFTIGQVGLFLAGMFHSALLVEPMLVLGPGHREEFGRYLRLVMVGHAGFSLVAAAALWLLATVLDDVLAVGLRASALALPFVLALWLARRACYVEGRTRAASIAGAGALLANLGGIAALRATGSLSVVSAFSLLGLVGAVTSVLLLGAVLAPFPATRSGASGFLHRALRPHLRLGRSFVTLVPFEWAPANFGYLVLPFFAGATAIEGAAAAALLKASMNLTQPMSQVHSALRMFLVPVFVRRRAARQTASDSHAEAGLLGVGVVMVGTSLAGYLLLYVYGEPLIAWIYGGHYPAAVSLVRVLGSIPVCTALCALSRSRLRALGRLDDEFRSYAAASGVAVLVGTPATWAFGVTGTAWSCLLAYATIALVQLGAWIRAHAQGAPAGSLQSRVGETRS